MTTEQQTHTSEESNKLVNKFYEMGVDGRIDLILMFHVDNKYKSKITNEQNELLKYVLSKFYPRFILSESGKSELEPDLTLETFDIMQQEELIKLEVNYNPRWGYVPTAKGHRINEKGGWLKHIANEETDRQAQRDLTRSVKMTNNIQIASAITTFFIISGGLTVAILDYSVNKQLLLPKQEQPKQEETIIAKEAQEKYMIFQTKIDSLYQALGELKKKSPSKN
jgi:hypothetical protein